VWRKFVAWRHATCSPGTGITPGMQLVNSILATEGRWQLFFFVYILYVRFQLSIYVWHLRWKWGEHCMPWVDGLGEHSLPWVDGGG
jgi:hypothetical protein